MNREDFGGFMSFRVEFGCIVAKFGRYHLGIAMNELVTFESFFLYLTDLDDSFTDVCAWFPLWQIGHFLYAYCLDLHLQVYSV